MAAREMFVSAILAAGGRGTRLGAGAPKQMLLVGAHPMLQHSFDVIEAHEKIDEIVVALPGELASAPPPYLISTKKPVRIVRGGTRRQDSVANAFAQVSDRATLVVVHDAARPFATADLFSRVIEEAAKRGAAIAAVQASDTIKEAAAAAGVRVVARTIARESVYLAQTPQAFTREVLEAAIRVGLQSAGDATDEAALAEQAGYPVCLVDGESTNIKITTAHDLNVAGSLAGSRDLGSRMRTVPRVGTGYDVHRLEPGRALIIGGVRIQHEAGLLGHSDADVLCHAVTDAVLGAAGLGDIGQQFPDDDEKWKGADSIVLLKRAMTMVAAAGYAVANIDAVIIAERPKLAPHVPAMRANIAQALGIDASAVSVKGKTNEKIDALGRNEAIAVHAVALVMRA